MLKLISVLDHEDNGNKFKEIFEMLKIFKNYMNLLAKKIFER